MTGLRAALAVVATAALLAGCSSEAPGGASPTTRTTPSTTSPSTTGSGAVPPDPAGEVAAVVPMGTYPVGTTTVRLVDTTRDTPANEEAPATKGRELPTEVFYPAVGTPGAGAVANLEPTVVDDGEARPGRYPLLVFSHGVTGRGTFYRGELSAWASAGYVVIAPDYPLSNADSPGGPTTDDVANQPGDASFLIDTFTDTAGDTPAVAIAAHVDGRHIGAVGHSLGAMTSLGLAYSACCTDPRVKAVAGWAGAFVPMKDKPNPAKGRTDPPLLLVHGERDETVPYRASESAFDRVEAPRWFVSLPGQRHTPPFVTPRFSKVAKLVTTVTVDFFDGELKGDPRGTDRLEAAVADAGPAAATLQVAP